MVNNIPIHIAAIMDGNGRWANKRGLPRIAGHKAGAESVREVLKACAELGVKYLTLYAFSTENWKRPKEEIDFLMTLFSMTIDREIKELVRSGVKLKFLGQLNKFSSDLQNKMFQAMEKTNNCERITLNIMVNYGGRAELVDAFKQISNEQIKNEEINEEMISSHLYTAGMPDPDLLIRTAGEMRVSNYLLWQIAYAEIYVTETCWPDFRKDELLKAIDDYQKRTRKFGKIAEQVNAD